MKRFEIKSFLDEKAFKYESPSFIYDDPIQIPHNFSKKEDIEISGFLTAIISWGNRKMIIKNAKSLMNLMDYSPFDFIFKGIFSSFFSKVEFLSSTVHPFWKY